MSFYQDIDYLERVGSYLTQNEGVCHIGEWHSHHQLGLARPSGGDGEHRVEQHATYNLKRFVIFIANLHEQKSKLNYVYNVDVGCFLFEIDDKGRQQRVLPGTFTIMQKALNPFLGKRNYRRKENMEKKIKKEQHSSVEVNKEARPRLGEEGKPEKKSDTKESARAAPRPLPKLEKEKAPATTTGKKSDTKESARAAPRPLPKLEKEKAPATTTGKKSDTKESARAAPRPLPQLGREKTACDDNTKDKMASCNDS
ncbi:hypothetical protein OS493_026271 [Desmophyllum pertusum]|uniref:Uncharacterized protein n=1 Tax=Desmophyllum pertusum TaxID=174260 RepID=A0A9W9ZLY6_9CNID|nr:hypothetical protein OS493_026271 [Desmophyllum pertusum]